jgi:dethiobiotin synthetase|tara:strand:+ start:114 stop:725 length:612 start_codon:yes stop_codon:yes gene_type:complete
MKLFVTGIGTDVGKTIVSAILTEALQADYWKPVQAGDLDHSDTHKAQALISNSQSLFHPEQFRLNHPMSPHAAAERDGINIQLSDFQTPQTDKHLIIEGAGGLMVPLNNTDCLIDLIPQTGAEVVLVSRTYLGSINHTLLSIETLQQRNIPIKGIIFNGAENKGTESVILSMTGINYLGRIAEEKAFDKEVITNYANIFKHRL